VKVWVDNDPDSDDPKTEELKVIAWNACDAIRRVNRPVVELPEPECDEKGRQAWVTWEDVPRKIYSPKEGPVDESADEDTVEDTEGFDAKAPTKKKKKKKK
jgi:hypothetical protein